MPIPEQRDLEAARSVIRDWLSGRLPDARDLTVSPLTGPAFTGFSNETLIFDATWTESGEACSAGYVIRVKPTAHTIFLESDFDSQHRVIKALARTDVPVPPVHWYEDDESVLGAPFFVMGKVEGRVPADNPPYTQQGWLKDEATPAERERVALTGLDAMTRIHRADWRALGLDILDKPHYGATGIDQQIAYYEKSFEWAAEGRPQPVAEAALEWVRANRPTGGQHLALAWGDARINNQMFDGGGNCIAVLDWEMVTLADPMMDLAWWLFLDRHFHEGLPAPRLEGFPTRAQMLARYEELTGWEPHDLEFYEVFAGLRFAVVMMRVTAMIVEFGLMPPDTDMGTNNIVTRLIAALLGLPSPGEPVPQV
jgi:aminoglycoside phosphotransferase (APT) family kinase protein